MKSGLNVGKLSWLVAMLVLIATTARAQTTDSNLTEIPRSMLKTAPINFEEINVSVERFHKADRSLQYGVGYIYQALTNTGFVVEPVAEEVNGVSLRLGYRMYSEKLFASPQGGYHGPLATYRYMAFPQKTYQDQFNKMQSAKVKQQVFSLQYMLGIQRVFKKWFVVDAYTGLGGRIKYASQTDTGTDAHYQYRFYGRQIDAGSDWVLLAAPSFSFNIAIGAVLK